MFFPPEEHLRRAVFQTRGHQEGIYHYLLYSPQIIVIQELLIINYQVIPGSFRTRSFAAHIVVYHIVKCSQLENGGKNVFSKKNKIKKVHVLSNKIDSSYPVEVNHIDIFTS